VKKKAFDLVIAGNISKDIIDMDGRKSQSTGGSVYYGALAAKKPGASLIVITRLASSLWRGGAYLRLKTDKAKPILLPLKKYKPECRQGRGDTCFGSYLGYRGKIP